MKKNQGQTVMGIMNRMEGVNLHEKKGGRFSFRMHMTQSMSDSPIEMPDLSVRAFNSLKRAGYDTIGDVTEAIASGADLHRIRSCGRASVREIMEHLFLYQYHSLAVDRQEEYLREVVEMNRDQMKYE